MGVRAELSDHPPRILTVAGAKKLPTIEGKISEEMLGTRGVSREASALEDQHRADARADEQNLPEGRGVGATAGPPCAIMP